MMMTNLLLATVIAFRLAGAAQSFDIPVQEGKAYHVTVTSHCDCYRPQPRMVAPIVEIFDAGGKPVAPATSSIRGVDHDISQYDMVNEKTFTARANGTYRVRITPLPANGYVGALREEFTSARMGGRTAVLSSSESRYTTPIEGATSGRLTLTIE